MKQYSEKIAIWLTRRFGTVAMMYLFMLYGAIGAFWVSHQPQLLYWSNWIQLWSLPLLLVGTNLLGRDAEKREARMAKEIDDIHSKLDKILVK